MTPSGPDALDAPHLRLLEDLTGPAPGPATPSAVASAPDHPLGGGDVGGVGDGEVDAAPEPTAGSCSPTRRIWPLGTCHTVPLTSRRRVVRSDTASIGAVGLADVDDVATPYWSSTRMKIPARKSFTRLWAPKPTATPARPAPAISRAEVDAELAEDRDEGDAPDHERGHRAQHRPERLGRAAARERHRPR